VSKPLHIFSILFLAVAVTATASAQVPQPPHEVYGQLTDNSEVAEGITVEAVGASGDTFSDTTDSNGEYLIQVPAGESIDSFDLVIDGDTEESDIEFESGASQNYDFSGDYIPSSGSSFSVSVDDVSVDEGGTVDLESSVSSEGSNPVYSWSVVGEDYGSFISDSDSQDAVFEASADVSTDREVEVELEVTKSGGSGSSKTGTGTVTIFDSSESDSPSGGAPPSEEEDQPEEDEEPGDDQPVEQPEPVDVEAQVDEETGSASGSAEASEGQTVTVSIPEQADEDVTGEVEGQEAATEVESVSATASGDTIVSVSVSSVSTDEVEQRQDNQVSYSNIEVDGEVSSQAITFSVRKSVLEERNASFEQVVKERYSDGSWEQLDTTHLEELDNSHRFEAETDGNSIFAVAIQEETSAPDEETDPGNETVEEKPDKDGMGVLPWIIGLLAILTAGAVYFKDEIADFAAEQVPDSTEEEK
jgi:PGF-pre-PGF domain-containing protein